MNKQNVMRVADAIERAELAPEFGFNMNYVEATRGAFAQDMTGRECGSVGCIAGWCAKLADNDDDDYKKRGSILTYCSDQSVFNRAQEWLDLSDAQAGPLFGPETLEDWDNITTAQAVATLRHLAETGDVVWKV